MIWRQLPSRMSFFYLKPTKVFPTPDLCTVLLRKFFFRMFDVVSSLYILGAQPLRPCIARVFSDCPMETTAFFSPSLSFPFVTWPSLFTLIELVMVSMTSQLLYPLVMWAPNLNIIFSSSFFLHPIFNLPGNNDGSILKMQALWPLCAASSATTLPWAEPPLSFARLQNSH